MKRQAKQGMAAVLSAAVVFSAMGTERLYAAEQDDSVKTIISFEELSEKYASQELKAGADEDDIRFPSGIWANVTEEIAEDEDGTPSNAERAEERPDATPSTPSRAEDRREDKKIREKSGRRKIRDIEWELNLMESTEMEFDSEVPGTYVYEPVIPEGYEWDVDLERPQIRVTVQEKEGTVTDAEGLKAELEAKAYSEITLGENIDFNEEVELGANHMVIIPEGHTLTVSKKITAGKLLTLTGEGKVLVSGAEAELNGRITVGANKPESKIRVSIENDGRTIPNGELIVWNEVSVETAGGIQLNTGKSLIIQENGSLTGTADGSIELAEGSKVSGAAGIFTDQEILLEEDGVVTVKAADAAASSDSLTAGTYVWDEESSSFAKEKQETPETGITTAEELKEALVKEESISICLGADITLKDTVELSADKTIEVPEGKKLTVTGNIKTGKAKITFTGGGTVLANGGTDCLRGKFYLGESEKANGAHMRLEGEAEAVCDDKIIIRKGGKLTSASSEGIRVPANKTLNIEEDGTLSGEAGGVIRLEKDAKVSGAAGLFTDQGIRLEEDGEVTVKAAGEAVSSDSLTAGTYVWDDETRSFTKEKEAPLPETGLNNGVLILSEQKKGDSAQGWDWDPGENLGMLNLNQRFVGNKQLVFVGDKPAAIKLNGNIILTPEAGEAAILSSSDLTLRADNEYSLKAGGQIQADGAVTVINKTLLEVEASSEEAAFESKKDITIKNDGSVTVNNSGSGAALKAGGSIVIKDNVIAYLTAESANAAVEAGSSVSLGGTPAVTMINQGTGPAVNKAPGLGSYSKEVRVSASLSPEGRPGEEYSPENIGSYRYLKIREWIKIEEDTTPEELDQMIDGILPDDFDAINDAAAFIHSMSPEEKAALSQDTIRALDELIQESTGITPVTDIRIADGVEIQPDKQIQDVKIYGALLAAGLDADDIGREVQLHVTLKEPGEGESAVFECFLTVDGASQQTGERKAEFMLPVTLKAELPPEYFPLTEDQIHQTGEGIDRWLDFEYDGKDNTAQFQTDSLSVFSLVRKGKPMNPGGGSSGGGGSSSGGSGGGGGSKASSGGPGIRVTEPQGSWIQDQTGWWYRYTDGSYPKDGWCQLEYAGQTRWYCFDKNGYMLTGWILSGEKWYYLNEVSDGSKGAMLTDTWVGAYYVNKDGVWEEGRKKQ